METETLQQKKIKLTPKLRFEEFEEPWNKQKLGTIASLISGFAFKGEHFTEEGQKVLIPKNFTQNGYGNFSENFLKYTTEKPEEKYECRRNDLLVLLTDLTSTCELLGKPLWLLEDDVFYLNQRIVKLLIDSDDLSKNFIFYSLQTENYHKKIVETATGSTVRHSSNKILLNYLLSLPNFPEQQKIATFLSAVDKKLQQLTRKKALLETYKKGVIQKLFSQEIRFKDYNSSKNGILERDFPEWEEKKLGQVLKIGSGKDYKHLGEGDIPVLGTGGTMTYVNDYLYEGESVGIGRKGTIDKPVYLTGKFWTVDTLFYTHSFNKVLPKFVYIIFQQINWRKHNEASGVPSLSKATIETIKVKIPCLEEQQKIANFLSAIDKKSEAVSQQIDKMQSFKKGLLQQMFI